MNTSYPVGLAALLGGRPPRYAVIDVGTNSVKFNRATHADDVFAYLTDWKVLR